MFYFGYLLKLGFVNGKFTLVIPYHVQLAPVLDREIQEIMGARSKQPYALYKMFELSTIPPSFKNAWEGQRSSIHGHFLQLGAERKLRLAKCYNLWSCMEQIKMSREQFIDAAGSQVFSAAIGSISGCNLSLVLLLVEVQGIGVLCLLDEQRRHNTRPNDAEGVRTRSGLGRVLPRFLASIYAEYMPKALYINLPLTKPNLRSLAFLAYLQVKRCRDERGVLSEFAVFFSIQQAGSALSK
ncbi:hypothetical protein B0H16DRAFT_1485151 [Mycena metata]|uniref:Uncharacterized protein n=1 Tax=Mycena metata TaxID=1033252 RepID=A0AAD7GMB5_9AGAR|nr:hypothetical protein B0H16DRAFT_1485151 [Mycena metata]